MIVKYNKNIQNNLNINLINYKFFSGRYLIFEEKGKVKEYRGDNDKLIYEGGYKNGKRSGYGKEYNTKGDLIYEGEYSNGKRYKVKEY